VSQSPASKDVNMELEQSSLLGAVIRQRLVKTEDLVFAVVICRVCRLVKVL
jgi:hypothetical protein